jgi:putative hydrolase of the HAD superfamily
MTLRAVLVDYGGVLVRTWDDSPRRAWAQRLGLEVGELARIVFESETARLAAIGKLDEAEHWRWVAQRLGLSPEEAAAFTFDFFAGDQADPELAALIRDLRPRYKTGLLSNCWPSLRSTLQHQQLDGLFDVLILSCEVGAAKPDPYIYQEALRQLGVAPHEAIFIDDFPANIEGARTLGLHTIPFRDTPSLKQALQALMTHDG